MRTADPTFLAQVPLFHKAPARALEIVSEAVQPRTFDADTVLFREGDRGEVLYILHKGTVKLFKIDLEGHEKTLAILKPPEFFGEMALLGEGGGARRRCACARRTSTCSLKTTSNGS